MILKDVIRQEQRSTIEDAIKLRKKMYEIINITLANHTKPTYATHMQKSTKCVREIKRLCAYVDLRSTEWLSQLSKGVHHLSTETLRMLRRPRVPRQEMLTKARRANMK